MIQQVQPITYEGETRFLGLVPVKRDGNSPILTRNATPDYPEEVKSRISPDDGEFF